MRPSCGGCSAIHTGVRKGPARFARVAALADPGNRRSWYAASRSRLVTSLVLAAPEISALFMGEEFLKDKIWSDDRSYNGLIYWAGLTTSDSTMRDFLQFTKDLLKLRNSQAAFRGPSARVSRAENFDRVIVLHRWLEGRGDDVVVVASVDELPKFGYTVGLPYGGTWRELFNSDYYYQFPNPAVIGNGGSVQASGGPLDEFTSSATMTIPGNGVIVLGR